MSAKDGKDYLYLIWKSERSRKQYIVGQLIKNGGYKFQYGEEIEEAVDDGFSLLLCFPDKNISYEDNKLFHIFASRLPDRKRKNIKDILKKYGMQEYDEYTLLKRSGARLPIDNLEFIDPILSTEEDHISRSFFMAGTRHYIGCQGEDCSNAITVTRGDEVFLQKDIGNKFDVYAIKIVDLEGTLLGYIPRYYSKGVSELLDQGKNVQCHISNVDKSSNCNECVKIIMKIG